jgi:CRISPR-associated protein Cas2
MARRRYLLLYDVRDELRLRRVHDVALAFGEALQYSVYVCDLTPSELIQLKWSLSLVIHSRLDSIALVDLGGSDSSFADRFTFLGPHRPLPLGGSTIV